MNVGPNRNHGTNRDGTEKWPCWDEMVAERSLKQNSSIEDATVGGIDDNHFMIGQRRVGIDQPVYIVAEISANHNQDFQQAVRMIQTAKDAGADAVKLQTYTPDTITIDCDNEYFQIKGTIWEGRRLYDLYGEAYMPWEWQPELKQIADQLDMALFFHALR